MQVVDRDAVLLLEEVGKKFCRNLKRNLFYGSLDVTRTMLGLRFDTAKLRRQEFWALDDININIKKGESIGVIGTNGAGKSTLLRLISGIFCPDKGRIVVRGRVGTLIALGAGFHPHFSGRENIFLNGTILSMTKKEIESRYDEIVQFADIGEFIDAPVSTYSSGMRVRLGFAIAIHSSPDILVIDEVLAVGDANFMKKSYERMESMVKDSGVTTIVVSHNMGTIQRLCLKTLTLQKGKKVFFGDTPEAISRYYEATLGEQTTQRLEVRGDKLIHHQDCQLTLYADALEILDENGQATDHIFTGAPVTFVTHLRNTLPVPAKIPRISLLILNTQMTELYTVFRTPPFPIGDHEEMMDRALTVACKVPCWNLAPGNYKLIIKVGSEEEGVYDSAMLRQTFRTQWSKALLENTSSHYTDYKCFIPAQWEVWR